MKKGIRSIFAGAGVLAACSVLGKVLGALYRIPLTVLLGGEGMGLYQTVFPLYTLILTVSSGGVPVAVASLVAKRRGEGDERGVRRAVNTALILFTCIGAVFTLITFALSKPIALLQGNGKAGVAYIAIAPSITFVGTIAVLRGYWQGREKMLPSALSQLIEQAVKLVLGLWLCKLFGAFGIEWAVFGAVLGVSVSELIAALGLLVPYLLKNKNGVGRTPSFSEFSADIAVNKDKVRGETLALIKEIFCISLPVTVGSLIMPVTAVADSVLVVNILSRSLPVAEATMAYGLLTGTVSTLVNLPVVIISALPTALLPRIAGSSDKLYRKKEIERTVRISLFLGFSCTLVFLFFSTPAVEILYGKSLSGEQISLCSDLLKLSGVSVIFVSLISSSTAALQGLGKAKVPAFNLAIGGAVKIAVTVIGLLTLGIYGAAAGTLACYAVTAVIDILALKKAISDDKSGEKERIDKKILSKTEQ